MTAGGLISVRYPAVSAAGLFIYKPNMTPVIDIQKVDINKGIELLFIGDFFERKREKRP